MSHGLTTVDLVVKIDTVKRRATFWVNPGTLAFYGEPDQPQNGMSGEPVQNKQHTLPLTVGGPGRHRVHREEDRA